MDYQKLIDLVFVRESLWDQKDKNHHNRYILDKLWDEVANEMQTTRDQVRNKWKNIRDSFRRELQKNSCRSGDAGGKKIKSSWPYFEQLSFLCDQFAARPSSGNCSQNRDENSDEASQLDSNNDASSNDNISAMSEPFSPGTSDDRGKSRCSSAASFTNGQTHSRPNKRKINDDFGQQLLDIEKEKLRKFDEINDEDVAFFNSLLPHVRKLSPGNKMMLRLQIQSLVSHFVYPELLPRPNAPVVPTSNVSVIPTSNAPVIPRSNAPSVNPIPNTPSTQPELSFSQRQEVSSYGPNMTCTQYYNSFGCFNIE